MSKAMYPILRTLFIVGNALSIVLLFIPQFRVRTARNIELMSVAEVMKNLSQSGHIGEFLVLMILGAVVPFVLIVLAAAYPKRWIFIVGASIAAFGILFSFFAGSAPNVERLAVGKILDFAVSLIVMGGFVTKPPRIDSLPEINQP